MSRDDKLVMLGIHEALKKIIIEIADEEDGTKIKKYLKKCKDATKVIIKVTT